MEGDDFTSQEPETHRAGALEVLLELAQVLELQMVLLREHQGLPPALV